MWMHSILSGACHPRIFVVANDWLRRAIVFLLASLPLVAGAGEPAACSIPGQPIQWIADYCMYIEQTDDVIAASACIGKQQARLETGDSCAIKRFYKTALCRLQIDGGLRKVQLATCVNDPGFSGHTVRNDAGTTVRLSLTDAQGVSAGIGEVSVSKTKHGLVFTPSLRGLPPGLHGFHLHQNPSCAAGEKGGKPVPALAAGDHYDPLGSKHHAAPWGDGHLGDLPPIYVDAQGNAMQPVLAPRLALKDLPGRALMVHAGGDNHADHPAPLGGGGARVACGVIGKQD